MPYLNLDLDYFNHPKTRRLIGLLGKGSEVIPIKIWAYVGKYHARDGKLTGYSAQEIESIVGWWGNEGEMIAALIKVGFLKNNKDGFYIHDWIDHEGHIVAYKEKAQMMANARWGRESLEDLIDAPSNACILENQKNLIFNLPDKSYINFTNQESEETLVKSHAVSNAVSNARTKLYLKKKNTTAETKIDFCWETFKFKNLTTQKHSLLKEKFPALDIDSEFKAMEAWLLANPKNRKSNYERFIVNWLLRSQDKAKRVDIQRKDESKIETNTKPLNLSKEKLAKISSMNLDAFTEGSHDAAGN